MNINKSCNLYQLEVLDRDIFNKWIPLNSIFPPGQEKNCGPNTLCYLEMVDREIAQRQSPQVEEAGGMPYSEIGQIIEAIKNQVNYDKNDPKYKITEQTYKINNEQIGGNLIDFFKKHLYSNHITILNLKRQGVGHILSIGRTHTGMLVIFDPQQRKIYDEYSFTGAETIGGYILNDSFTEFSVYCETNKRKRSLNDIYSIIRKDKTQESPPKKQKVGGKKSKKKTKKSKKKTKKSKKKTKKSKKKTKKSKKKTKKSKK